MKLGLLFEKDYQAKALKLAFSAGHGELSSLPKQQILQTHLSDFYSLDRINLNLRDSNCYKIFCF